MSNLAERISALNPEQRALLEARLRKRGLQAEEPQRIPPRQRTAGNLYPPSIDQERLWFIEQLQPGNTAYNIFSASRLAGPLNVAVMERVINEIVRRHEVLRTTFRVIEGQPMQFIAPSLKISLAPVDLQSLPEDEREARALQLTTEEFTRPFDLEKGPLIRVGLFRLSPADHLLYLNMHHTVTDRWSGAIFEQELEILYRAFAAGQPSPLPELPIQFADYAIWQRERMGGEAYGKQLAYWKERLASAPHVLELPSDFPRPAIQTFRGARVYFRFSRKLLDALKELSRREGATMYMTLMAAYKVLLYRYTQQSDLLVGCSIANRERPETQGMIGFLLNLLVLRTDLSGNPGFRELLKRERETALGAYAHQDLPFGKLVQELRPRQDASRNPVVQVAFIFLDFPELATMESFGITARHVDIDNGASRFDLTLALTETSEGLEGSLEYLSDLFERSRIERMARHLEVLLEGIVAAPETRLDDLPLLTHEEREQLLREWPSTRRHLPQVECIQNLFEAVARRQPEALAIDSGDERVSYGELERRSNQLARHLQSLGIRAEARVGILIERSVEMLVAVLGVLKAGGTYVPFDPSSPPERISYMMEDACVIVLLTQPTMAALPECKARVVRLDTERGEIALNAAEPVESGASADNSAYIIYTSGSTGRPKGVVVSHRNLVHSTTARLDYYPGPVERLLLLISLAFDGSGAAIFWALGLGGALVLMPEGEQADPALLARRIEEKRISHLMMLPSLYGLLLDHGHARQLTSLRLLVLAAESFSPELVRRHREALPQTSLFNEYGPTEAAIWSTVYDCDAYRVGPHVPLGRPIANTQVYILDQHQEPVPVGVPGELCIAGPGLARGYLNRPDLTAESFIPHRFGGEPGARLYRSGDLARYESNGEIVFLGRLDAQVKLRGYRIETGEIEFALISHRAIRAAAVVLREDTPGDKRLVAYIVGDEDSRLTTDELAGFLKMKLPGYMIPSIFIFLDQLPLMHSGKVDRHALPPPQMNRPDLRQSFVPPQTLTQELLAQLWTRVLKLKQAGIHDDFFESGGDSLLATQFASQVRRAFEIELPLLEVFKRPTIAALSELVEEELAAQMEGVSDEEAERLLQEESEA